LGIMRRLYSSIEKGVCDWLIRPLGHSSSSRTKLPQYKKLSMG
jgi:hypothetical protein